MRTIVVDLGASVSGRVAPHCAGDVWGDDVALSLLQIILFGVVAFLNANWGLLNN